MGPSVATYVHPADDGLNRVDYGSFQANGHAELKPYLESLRAVDPRTLSRSEQFAFLANLYNAKTIDIVLDHYPVSSIKNVSLGGGLFAAFTGGPWKAKVLTSQARRIQPRRHRARRAAAAVQGSASTLFRKLRIGRLSRYTRRTPSPAPASMRNSTRRRKPMSTTRENELFRRPARGFVDLRMVQVGLRRR